MNLYRPTIIRLASLFVAVALVLSFALCGLVWNSARAGEISKGARKVDTGLDGAKLWAQTCMQCHNARPAKEYSNAQWDVIVHHMQVRAKLTLPESHAIADFLKEGK